MTSLWTVGSAVQGADCTIVPFWVFQKMMEGGLPSGRTASETFQGMLC